MTCPDFARYLQAYCDGELDVSKMLEVEEHLQGCPSCSAAVEAEEAFRKELRRTVAQEPVPPHIAERLRSAVAALEEEPKRFCLHGGYYLQQFVLNILVFNLINKYQCRVAKH
ncbi:MAG: zf-HC2 domain-containing protein, partial [candidate division NC10 bacterium]